MAAGNFQLYNAAIEDVHDQTIDLEGDAMYAMLATSSYTPAATHTTYANISGDEIADGDYTRQVIAGQAVSQPVAGTIRFDISDIDFGNSVTLTAKYLVIVIGTAASPLSGNLLLCYLDLDTGGGSVSSTNGNFDIAINANGVFETSQTS